MGLKLIFIRPPHTLPPTDGEDKHFIVFCVKCLLVPAAQQWGRKQMCPMSFLTAFVFLITVKEAFNF